MNALLVAIDARYIQTNLAVRSLVGYANEHKNKQDTFSLTFGEFTINQPLHHIVDSLYHHQADVYLFSTYIWNIEAVKAIIPDLKAIRPEAKFFLGGPEATYDSDALLSTLPELDGILLGEGEATLLELLSFLEQKKDLKDCAGLALPSGYTDFRLPVDMDTLPFGYENLEQVTHRILYYESMRGCPFQCSYCLSSVERGVRYRSLPLVFKDLQRFLDSKVKQVKFVDRTFNCKKSHAMAIWKYLKENDNGITNFHFELAGELIDEEMISFLRTLRPGLCQFEIGVQSTSKETLEEIKRPFSFSVLTEKVNALQQTQNIHLHLDLIAGLPYESYQRFQISFNDVYALAPHQLQLGFLKVLGGSAMQTNAPEYGLVHQRQAPYEVLKTSWISYGELSELHGVADMVDHYYNSRRYHSLITYLTAQQPYQDNPFQFYLALSQHFQQVTKGRPLSKLGYYELLGSFQQEQGKEITETMQWLCKYDMLLHENLRHVPDWVTVSLEQTHREWMREFYGSEENIKKYLSQYVGKNGKRISRITHMEVFPFHPETGKPESTAVLFDYSKRDIVDNATAYFINIE